MHVWNHKIILTTDEPNTFWVAHISSRCVMLVSQALHRLFLINEPNTFWVAPISVTTYSEKSNPKLKVVYSFVVTDQRSKERFKGQFSNQVLSITNENKYEMGCKWKDLKNNPTALATFLFSHHIHGNKIKFFLGAAIYNLCFKCS